MAVVDIDYTGVAVDIVDIAGTEVARIEVEAVRTESAARIGFGCCRT